MVFFIFWNPINTLSNASFSKTLALFQWRFLAPSTLSMLLSVIAVLLLAGRHAYNHGLPIETLSIKNALVVTNNLDPSDLMCVPVCGGGGGDT